jgi:hypothetical protein
MRSGSSLFLSFRFIPALNAYVFILIGRAANYKRRTPLQFRFSLNARRSVAAMQELRLDFGDVTQKLRNALVGRVELPPSSIVGI